MSKIIIFILYLTYVGMIVFYTKHPKRKIKRETIHFTGWLFASFTGTILMFSLGWNMIWSILIPGVIWGLTPKIILAIFKKTKSKEEQ